VKYSLLVNQIKIYLQGGPVEVSVVASCAGLEILVNDNE
jgi:hypothetical protein